MSSRFQMRPQTGESMKSSISLPGSLLVCLALSACEEGRESLPNTTVSVVHAAPSYLTINFLREERVEAELDFTSASRHSFDADEYDFNVEVSPPGTDGTERIATFAGSLSADNDHYIVLAEDGGEIEPVLIEEPVFDFESSESEFSIFHAAGTLGEVDVYIEPPDADPAAASPLGGIGFLERIDPATFAADDYRITLTEPGAPGDVVYRSNTFSASAGQDNLLVITDGANRNLSAANVVRVNTSPGALADVSTQSALRVVNGANNRENRDVVLDEDFDTPLFADLPFAAAVDYEMVAPGEHDLTVTPAGNPGVLELEDAFSATRGGYYTYIFGGTASAGLEGAAVLEDRRPINGTARVRVANAAMQFEQLDVLIVEAGGSLTDAATQLQLSPPSFSELAALPPDDYEIGFRETDTETIVAGPVSVTLAERGLYTIIAVDGTDTTSAELVLLDDFQ